MDKQSLVTFIVDLLRHGPEQQALAQGGPQAQGAPMGIQMPQGQSPLHNGVSPEQMAAMAERGNVPQQ